MAKTNSSSISDEGSGSLEDRLSLIQRSLEWDERLKTLEAALVSKKGGRLHGIPWWRDSKTVTILAALLAAIIPLVTAIDGLLKNTRESNRAVAEQQDKIRQIYL